MFDFCLIQKWWERHVNYLSTIQIYKKKKKKRAAELFSIWSIKALEFVDYLMRISRSWSCSLDHQGWSWLWFYFCRDYFGGGSLCDACEINPSHFGTACSQQTQDVPFRSRLAVLPNASAAVTLTARVTRQLTVSPLQFIFAQLTVRPVLY